ncbi:MAG: hypothetical protein ABWK01_01915 [Infirmifilum sp.]
MITFWFSGGFNNLGFYGSFCKESLKRDERLASEGKAFLYAIQITAAVD